MASVATETPKASAAALPAPKYRYSPEEYLDFERRSSDKHAYFNGEIFATVGASRAHNLITANLIKMLGVQLDDRPFEVYPPDMRVKVLETGLFTYPDVSVVAGEPKFADEEFDNLLNPVLVAEVLSVSTEEYDRAGKFEHYRRIPTLQFYLLVSQYTRHIELRNCQPDGNWSVSRFPESGSAVPLASIGCELKFEEIYRKVPRIAES